MTFCNMFSPINSFYDNSSYFSGYSSGFGVGSIFTAPSFNFDLNSLFTANYNINSFTFNNCLFNFNMPNFDNINFMGNNFLQNNFNFSNLTFPQFDFNLSFSNISFTSSGISSSQATRAGQRMVENAMYYVGKINNDAQGVAAFSPKGSPVSRGWCSDFATYIAAKSIGSKYPKSMVTGSPHVLREEAKKNHCWVNGWSSSAKPGDIIIVPGKGVSGLHVAIIKTINSDGTVRCVSGNSRNSVRESNYSTSSVKGFVSIEKLV